MCGFLKQHAPRTVRNEAYSTLAAPDMTPRHACQDVVSEEVNPSQLRSCLGASQSMSSYLIYRLLPGFEHEAKDTEVVDGVHNAPYIKA